MVLRRHKTRKVWIFQAKVNGKTWSRSTGTRNRRLAEAKAQELARIAAALRTSPQGSLTLLPATTAEVDLVRAESGEYQAERAETSFAAALEYLGDAPLEKLTPERIAAFAGHRAKTLAASTVSKDVQFLLRLLRRNGFDIPRPKLSLRRATEHRAFTIPELVAFFAACTPPQRLLYAVTLALGARSEEILPSARPNAAHIPLLKQDVDIEAGIVRLRSAKTGAPPRTIKLPPALIAPLKDQIESHDGPTVFPPIYRPSKAFNAILDRAKIAKRDPLGRTLDSRSSLRHTFATFQAEAAGQNPFVLMQTLGHRSITTTQRYTHAAPVQAEIDFAAILGPEPLPVAAPILQIETDA